MGFYFWLIIIALTSCTTIPQSAKQHPVPLKVERM